ncbi:MYG1 family protein, partial [Shewanella sp. CG_4_10_14_0_8_um_filter_42_13]|uniref:MYG1 family protein n=1 Tax=Shewanella sp. CG_4_10_14_0_8_um_filter_42_13 TaxID=1975534 RepID=UPI000CA9CFCF
EISNNKIVAQKIDRILIQPIDAGDNGTAYYKPLFGNILPYEFHSIFGAYSPSWKENTDLDKLFLKMVMLAKDIIKREIKKNTDSIEMEKIIENIYQNTYDKRIIVVTLPFSRFDIVNTLGKYKKPIYAIYPERGDKDWRIVGINKRPGSYLTRKPLPKSWAGKTGEAFRKVTGIKEAKFCHRTKFLAVADNKEGAIALARLSLNKK